MHWHPVVLDPVPGQLPLGRLTGTGLAFAGEPVSGSIGTHVGCSLVGDQLVDVRVHFGLLEVGPHGEVHSIEIRRKAGSSGSEAFPISVS